MHTQNADKLSVGMADIFETRTYCEQAPLKHMQNTNKNFHRIEEIPSRITYDMHLNAFSHSVALELFMKNMPGNLSKRSTVHFYYCYFLCRELK